MKKILFLIHDLGQGGAEKVLVNLVNNMNREKYDITVMSIFDVGVNKQFLHPNIKYKYCFKRMIRGNSHFMKLFTPKYLHKMLIKEKYDVEIAYLEGPCTRIISGCKELDTKLISWIHSTQKSVQQVAASYLSIKEVKQCYEQFDQVAAVSQEVKDAFLRVVPIKVPVSVIYNTNESDKIREKSLENSEMIFEKDEFNIIAAGKLTENKGFDRVIRVVKKLKDEGKEIHFYILGEGEKRIELEQLVKKENLDNNVSLLGYQTNPYKYIKQADLFVCSSYSEGFSTATTEALIVGVPVCTVDVSGMKEMLGKNNDFGVIVDNNENALFEGIKRFVTNTEYLNLYKRLAIERGEYFSTNNTVRIVEELIEELIEERRD